MHYHEDPTPTGETRTQEQLAIVKKWMRNDAMADAGIQIAILVVAVLVIVGYNGLEGILPVIIAWLLISSAMVFKAFAQYRSEEAMANETLGVTKSKSLELPKAPGFIKSLCKATDVPEPNIIGYSGWQYTGEYDPNRAVITLGTPLQHYETDAALMTAAHEASHHIMLHSKYSRDKEILLLRCAAICDTVGVCFAFLFILAFLMGANVQYAWFYLSVFLVAQLLKCGILTTHENKVNTVLMNLYTEKPELFEGISDVEQAFRSLSLGTYTYYADLAMWVIISLVFTFTAAMV